MTEKPVEVDRVGSVAFAMVTGVVTWLVFWGVCTWWGAEQPALLASGLFFSLFLHELCHALVLERAGVKTMMFFLVLGAGVAPAPQYMGQYDLLSSSKRAELYLAGVFGNLLIAFSALALKWAGLMDAGWADWLASINASLAGFNLIPWGRLDGGQFSRLLFDSISEDRDHRFAFGIGAAILVGTGVAVFLSSGTTPLLVPLVVAFQLPNRAVEDDPLGSLHPKAMTPAQQRWWACVYVSLFLSAVLIGF